MAKILATIKAIVTRLIFVAHGFVAIWQVTQFKMNSFYWYLCVPMLLLLFEGIFTLTIKTNQEWKWFCPSVFLYLSSVVPSIWLLELDKVEKRLKAKEETFNLTASADFRDLRNLLGVEIKLPQISLSTEMWVTLIEQFLMLTLIVGRWLLPKGDLTRDQLSQLLLVYIGTAADIIEFFDSFKDDKIASEPMLVLLTLAIWSWSLMQFTIVLTATKSRKSRLSTSSRPAPRSAQNFCNIDVWGIILNITLQDAPFLVFRLLIIIHFNIISYMNVFFTCKNTLVILLQLYRLYVVYSENRKNPIKQTQDGFELTNISIIAKPETYKLPTKRADSKRFGNVYEIESSDESENQKPKEKPLRKLQNTRKDTGYSTGSSHTALSADEKRRLRKQKELNYRKPLESDLELITPPRRSKPIRKHKIRDVFLEETGSEINTDEERKLKKKKSKKEDAKIESEINTDEERKIKRKKSKKEDPESGGIRVKKNGMKSKGKIVKVVSSASSDISD